MTEDVEKEMLADNYMRLALEILSQAQKDYEHPFRGLSTPTKEDTKEVKNDRMWRKWLTYMGDKDTLSRAWWVLDFIEDYGVIDYLKYGKEEEMTDLERLEMAVDEYLKLRKLFEDVRQEYINRFKAMKGEE